MLNCETSGKVQIRKLVIIAAALGCLLTDSFDEAVFPTAFHAETDAPVGAVISLGNLLEYMIYLLPF